MFSEAEQCKLDPRRRQVTPPFLPRRHQALAGGVWEGMAPVTWPTKADEGGHQVVHVVIGHITGQNAAVNK